MNRQSAPERVRLREGEWLLSGPALIDLMQATLAKGVPFRLRARGSSMHPFVKGGDLIVVSPLKTRSPVLGDVVAFVQAERLVVHRVIAVSGNGYFMKGDATEGRDGPVPVASVLGLVTRVEREGERVLIGLGPERILIAMLARRGLALPLVRAAASFLRPIRTLAMILSISSFGRR